MRHYGIYDRKGVRSLPVRGLLRPLLGLAMTIIIYLFISNCAYAAQFGILSETYVYPDGLRIDTDSKLFVWNATATLSDDAVDKREGENSLKGVAGSQTWFGFGIIWDSNNDNVADPKNMSAYSSGSLNLWVKTEVNLQVGIEGPAQNWVPLSNYGVLTDNQWRFVSIPFSAFSGIDFTQVKQLFMVRNGSTFTAGKTFHFDNVRWNTTNVGALDHINISPAPWTMPTNLPKSFLAKGYDINNNERDIYPVWSALTISGSFSPTAGPLTVFTAGLSAASGSVRATDTSVSGSAAVTTADITWNDFFNIFIDEGLYGILGAYDADGAGTDNTISLDTVTDVHPPGINKSLKMTYDITNNGWAGVFIEYDEPIIYNPDMESGSTTPDGWTTVNNELTNETGWVSDVYHSSTHSLKIVRTTVANAYWAGQTVSIDEPYPTVLTFSGWAKAQDVSGGSFRLRFRVTFEDGTFQYSTLNFTPGTHDWEKAETTQTFTKPVVSIRPICQLSNGTGTAWFDDIEVRILKRSLQPISNPDMESGALTPDGWTTVNNELTNETGWATDYYHSSTHSLKIVRTTVANAYWAGQTVSIDQPYPTVLTFSGWAKAQDVSGGSFRLRFRVTFEDGTFQYSTLNFTPGTHDWEKVEITPTFSKPVVSIRPICQLSNGTGTAWFDDIEVRIERSQSKYLSLFEDGYLYFWVKAPADLEIGLRSFNVTAGEERSKVRLSEYDIPADDAWHEVYIALNDFKIRDERLDFSQAKVLFNAAVVGEYTGANSGIFYLSDVKYVRHKETTPALTISIKRRSDNATEPLGKITYSAAALKGGWEMADQYLSVVYDTGHPSWGAQIYTDNMGPGASPAYGGDPTRFRNQQPTGLIGVSDTILNCPMAWMALDDVNTNVPRPVEAGGGVYFDSDTGGMWGTTPALSEWSWLKDKNSTKWVDLNTNGIVDPGEMAADFSLTGDAYSTFIESAGIATGWFNPDGTERVYILNPQPPIVIYLAAKFTKATVLQRYKTNTLTMELYHY